MMCSFIFPGCLLRKLNSSKNRLPNFSLNKNTAPLIHLLIAINKLIPLKLFIYPVYFPELYLQDYFLFRFDYIWQVGAMTTINIIAAHNHNNLTLVSFIHTEHATSTREYIKQS